jgi:hypothetical protein
LIRAPFQYRVRAPASASSQASMRPVGPAPTTITSMGVMPSRVAGFDGFESAKSPGPYDRRMLHGRERESAEIDALLAAAGSSAAAPW